MRLRLKPSISVSSTQAIRSSALGGADDGRIAAAEPHPADDAPQCPGLGTSCRQGLDRRVDRIILHIADWLVRLVAREVTVPFSLLGAVENMSRDWVIDKIAIGTTYDSDLTLAKKLIKQIGLDLAKDPEFAPLIREPLKMQGVEELGDFAVQIRAKMMTVPREQFVIRRQAYAMIKQAFDANGIKFAFPTVQIAGEGEAATAAAAQRALELTKPAAAAVTRRDCHSDLFE
jgi:hypothetical protein